MSVFVLIHYMINVIWILKVDLYFWKILNFHLIQSIHCNLLHYDLSLHYIARFSLSTYLKKFCKADVVTKKIYHIFNLIVWN